MEYLTVEQAAQILGVSVSTVKKRLKEGSMKGEKAGPRIWLLLRSDVEAMPRGKFSPPGKRRQS